MPDQPHTGESEYEGYCKRCGVRDPMDDNGTNCCEYGHDWTDELPPHTGEARVDPMQLHAIAQQTYNAALSPRDTTFTSNDAMHEAVDAVLAALSGEGDIKNV